MEEGQGLCRLLQNKPGRLSCSKVKVSVGYYKPNSVMVEGQDLYRSLQTKPRRLSWWKVKVFVGHYKPNLGGCHGGRSRSL
jgi:hypothetical protein